MVDAHVGRVAGQSKQTVLAGVFLTLRNWAFLLAVGMQAWPFPAAVMDPSSLMLPDTDMVVFVWSLSLSLSVAFEHARLFWVLLQYPWGLSFAI